MDANFDPKNQSDDLICPITLEVFRDPVIAKDGHIYERQAIEKWIFEHGTSPITREPLEIDDLIPATYLQPRIAERQNSIISSKASSDVIIIPPVDKADHIKKPRIYTIAKSILHAMALIVAGLLAAAAVIIGIIILLSRTSGSRGFTFIPPFRDTSTSTLSSSLASTFRTTSNESISTDAISIISSLNTTISTPLFEFNSTIFNSTITITISSNESVSTNASSFLPNLNTTIPTSSFGSNMTVVATIFSTRSTSSSAPSATTTPSSTVSKSSSSSIPTTKSLTSSSASISTTKSLTSSSASIPMNVMSMYSSALTSNNPTFSLFDGWFLSYYYEVISVTLSASGYYEFTSESDFDTRAYFYYESFDQYNPYKNFIGSDNSGRNKQFKLQLYLQKKTKYFLVLTSKFPNKMGSFTVYANGPSQVNFSSKTTVTTTTTPPSICAQPEVHVIGIYKSNKSYRNHHHQNYYSADSVTVKTQKAGEQTLVLSSYESTKWRIELAHGATLRAIYLIGYNEQSVESPYDYFVVNNLDFDDRACGYSWPYYDEYCDTNKLLSLARKYVGGEITSFHGCYQATQWTIDDNSHATSNCETRFGFTMNEFYPTCVAAF